MWWVACAPSPRRDGGHVRERLLTLDDANYSFAYNFEKPAFPVRNYIATVRLYPITHTDETFAEWESTFDEAAGDEGKYEAIISRDVFAANWANLAKIIAAKKPKKPEGCGALEGLSAEQGVDVPGHPRAGGQGMGRHARLCRHGRPGMRTSRRMHMLGGVRSDKVSGIRDFYFGEGHLNEELLHLCDRSRSFSYRITKCEIPWINYVSGARLWPVTANNTTFGVWTGDWDASPQDDLLLIPGTEANVYQKAFATVERKLRGK